MSSVTPIPRTHLETVWDKKNPEELTITGFSHSQPQFIVQINHTGAVNLLESLTAIISEDGELQEELNDYNEPEYQIIPILYKNFDQEEVLNLVGALAMGVEMMDINADKDDALEGKYTFLTKDGKLVGIPSE